MAFPFCPCSATAERPFIRSQEGLRLRRAVPGAALCFLLITVDPFGLLEVRKVRRGESAPDFGPDVQRMGRTMRWLLFTPIVVGALLACCQATPAGAGCSAR